MSITASHYDFINQAIQFRQVNDQPISCFTPEILGLQLRLIEEEFKEFGEAHQSSLKYIQNHRSREQALKELADLVYVCFQYAVAAGWELDEALARVHESNLSKLVDGKPLKDEQGKVLKGPNYQPPYLEDLI